MDIDNIRFVLGWISAIIGTVFLVLIMVFRFSNPELTETQIFIANWHYGVGSIVFYAASQMLLRYD
tara:strand:+ start:85 stop:282 length:198 start_codon:yes stop_codon:yes gene_type:complete